MFSKRFVTFFLIISFVCILSRSVSKKKKDQVKLDKEVLLDDDDDDYDDEDVLDLTIEEQKDRLKSLVEKKIDVNHDGYVDLKELQAWSLKAFDSFESGDVKEEFSSIDADKDHFVSWDEFAEDMFSHDFSYDEADEKTKQQFMKESRLYNASDLNNDTLLSLEEYLIFRIPRSHSKTKDVVISDALANHDADGDNAISLQEFLKETNHDADDEDFIESETERFNKEFDRNGDGLLTGDEILMWIDPDNTEDAHDEADHLMDECDVDKDQKLSADEILSNHHLWVESDATDYGRHLLLDHDEF